MNPNQDGLRRLTLPRQDSRTSTRNPATASADAMTPVTISQVPASRSSPIAVARAVNGPLGRTPDGKTGWKGDPGAAANVAKTTDPTVANAIARVASGGSVDGDAPGGDAPADDAPERCTAPTVSPRTHRALGRGSRRSVVRHAPECCDTRWMNTSDGPRGPWPDPDERGEARPDPGEPEDPRAEDERLRAEAEAIGSDAAAVAADLGAASDRLVDHLDDVDDRWAAWDERTEAEARRASRSRSRA